MKSSEYTLTRANILELAQHIYNKCGGSANAVVDIVDAILDWEADLIGRHGEDQRFIEPEEVNKCAHSWVGNPNGMICLKCQVTGHLMQDESGNLRGEEHDYYFLSPLGDTRCICGKVKP